LIRRLRPLFRASIGLLQLDYLFLQLGYLFQQKCIFRLGNGDTATSRSYIVL
jgi:hypothetical protein